MARRRKKPAPVDSIGQGARLVDVGEGDVREKYDHGPQLIIFAVDPGITTGWSALRVPVATLAGQGTARTLARCAHRHGQVLRSGLATPSGGGGSYSMSDSRHVSDIFEKASEIYEEWMLVKDVVLVEKEVVETVRKKKGGEKKILRIVEVEEEDFVVDEESRMVFVLEGFDLRESSMDANLLSPVRVNSIFMDRLVQNESETRTFFQSPSDAKRTCPDGRLRSWGFYDSKSGAHARDADRHAVLFLRRFASSPVLREAIFGDDPFSRTADAEGYFEEETG